LNSVDNIDLAISFSSFFQFVYADASKVMTARAYAIQITASQFLDKPRDASAIVALSCNWELSAISRYTKTKRCKLALKLLLNVNSYAIYRMVSFTVILS